MRDKNHTIELYTGFEIPIRYTRKFVDKKKKEKRKMFMLGEKKKSANTRGTGRRTQQL